MGNAQSPSSGRRGYSKATAVRAERLCDPRRNRYLENWHETAETKPWGLKIGQGVYTRICWAGDNILIAKGWKEQRSMCRLFEQIMPKVGMNSDWGDSEKWSWIITETRAAEHFTIGEAKVQTRGAPYLGVHFQPQGYGGAAQPNGRPSNTSELSTSCGSYFSSTPPSGWS